MHAGELLTLRTPVPRSKVIAGVIIDDLVVMEKMLISSADGLVKDAAGASSRIVSAMNGYNENSLEANIKKSFFNETSCRFWGAEVDGRKGLVRSSSLRAWPLMVISMKIASLCKIAGEISWRLDLDSDHEEANVLCSRHHLRAFGNS